MPDKGKIMSQSFYERQTKLFKLYQEAYTRREMDVNEAVLALKRIGFSEKMAANRVGEWTANVIVHEPETDKAKKNRQRQLVSLEKYVLRMTLGKKHFIRLQYKRNELSKNDAVKKLIQSGYSKDLSENTVDTWGDTYG
jgi:hypothetical protein